MDKHQLNLFGKSNRHLLKTEPEFQGSDYVTKHDKKRLTGQTEEGILWIKGGEAIHIKDFLNIG
jgi:hypothetical protein